MSKGQFIDAFNAFIQPFPSEALPVITFLQTFRFVYMEKILWCGTTPAYTDGNVVIEFKLSNVIQGVDIFWNGKFPVID